MFADSGSPPLVAAEVGLPDGGADDELWEELLQLIEEARVVPIVGCDLLSVEIDGQTVLLHHWLARRSPRPSA